MATNNSINLSASGIVKYDGAGTFTGITLTQHSPLIGGASNAITSLGPLTNGQLIIGNTSNDPSAATLTAGTGVTITNGAGTITVASAGGGMTWNTVSGTTQAAAINNGYYTNNAGLCTVTLPTTAAAGSVIAVTSGASGSGGWLLAQNSGQSINFGKSTTTSGASGSLASTFQYDTVFVLCVVANTNWVVINSIGNLTVV
jgi:hypothetical protein